MEGNKPQEISMRSLNQKRIFCIQDDRCLPRVSVNLRHFHVEETL